LRTVPAPSGWVHSRARRAGTAGCDDVDVDIGSQIVGEQVVLHVMQLLARNW
jgi:hypothetical protein